MINVPIEVFVFHTPAMKYYSENIRFKCQVLPNAVSRARNDRCKIRSKVLHCNSHAKCCNTIVLLMRARDKEPIFLVRSRYRAMSYYFTHLFQLKGY